MRGKRGGEEEGEGQRGGEGKGRIREGFLLLLLLLLFFKKHFSILIFKK